ncbi:MAG: N-acetylneuraminate synthase family protein [Planctomycetota bacterium]
MNGPKLVAEVSSNHHRDRERCLRFVDVAAECGCQAIKFQQFRVRELFHETALQYNPALREREAWELPEEFNAEIAARAHARGIEFASTPFYWRAIDVLAPLVDFFKLASYQILWLDFLAEVAARGRPVVLSTGMATLDEVAEAVDAIVAAGCDDLTLLHCVSTYPTPVAQANLRAIGTLREAFGRPAGWSDHTVDVETVVRAVKKHGAELVEFHFDLDGKGAEFSGRHCWLPAGVRALQAALADAAPPPPAHPSDGDGRKVPRAGEADERLWRSDPSDGRRPLREKRRELRAGGAR